MSLNASYWDLKLYLIHRCIGKAREEPQRSQHLSLSGSVSTGSQRKQEGLINWAADTREVGWGTGYCEENHPGPAPVPLPWHHHVGALLPGLPDVQEDGNAGLCLFLFFMKYPDL